MNPGSSPQTTASRGARYLRRAAGARSGFVGAALLAAATIAAGSALAQDGQAATEAEYTITVMPPGGPAPRLANGKPDFTGLWLPNSAGQGVSGRFGVDPAARRQFDPDVTPEEPPSFQPWAAERIAAMTPLEIELSKSSVNCMPRGVPAIWLQNPYGTMLVHKPGLFAQLYEVLNNFRVIYTDGRPIPEYPEPLFHGNSTARWEGDTLVVESTDFDERTYILPNGWFHSDQLRVIERYSRPSMNWLIVEVTVEDPEVLTEPWTSAPRRWTLTTDPINEFYCTNNRDLEELERLREIELAEQAEADETAVITDAAEEASTVSVTGISAETLLAEIRMLASDEFEGRAPGSPGEELTVDYLIEQFSALGAVPGNPDGTWVQDVPLVGITPRPPQNLVVSDGTEMLTLEPATDYVAATKHVVDAVAVDGAEFVFVGYGARAPEYDWDDFGDADLSGKILLFLVNDPPLDDIFGGPAMTYYGRWMYKHEIAAELGAAGSLVVHETGPAGYPWEVIGATPFGESFDLAAPDDNLGRATIEGWMQRATAEAIFEMAGLDFETAKQQAAVRGFEPIPLGLTGSIEIRNEIRRIDSLNVVAKVEGSEAPDEVLIYVAHWDHMGRDESLEGDQIFNGAADNATGTAGLIELARAYSLAPQPPRRSVLFLAVTAEEQGLLGSFHYGRNPLYPAAQTVAALNMDGLNQWGRTRDLTIVGLGQSELDDVAVGIAGELGRTLAPDPEPEKGFYYRSDHFAFARAGVPAFYADPGVDYIDKPEGYGLQKRNEYTTNDYHKVTDEVKPDWDMSGAVEDLTFLYLMGRRLADGEQWPVWSETSEFRALRESQRPQ